MRDQKAQALSYSAELFYKVNSVREDLRGRSWEWRKADKSVWAGCDVGMVPNLSLVSYRRLRTHGEGALDNLEKWHNEHRKKYSEFLENRPIQYFYFYPLPQSSNSCNGLNISQLQNHIRKTYCLFSSFFHGSL